MNTKSLRYTVAALAMQCLLVAAPAPAQASGGGDDRSPVLSNWEIEAATGLSLTEIGNRWWAFAFEHLDFLFDTTARSTVAAILGCQNYDFLPKDQYDVWKDLVLNFNPNMFADTAATQ